MSYIIRAITKSLTKTTDHLHNELPRAERDKSGRKDQNPRERDNLSFKLGFVEVEYAIIDN